LPAGTAGVRYLTAGGAKNAEDFFGGCQIGSVPAFGVVNLTTG